MDHATAIVARPDGRTGWLGRMMAGAVHPSAIGPAIITEALDVYPRAIPIGPTVDPSSIGTLAARWLYLLAPAHVEVRTQVRPHVWRTLALVPAGIRPTVLDWSELDRAGIEPDTDRYRTPSLLPA